jgi:hypothetical protein
MPLALATLDRKAPPKGFSSKFEPFLRRLDRRRLEAAPRVGTTSCTLDNIEGGRRAASARSDRPTAAGSTRSTEAAAAAGVLGEVAGTAGPIVAAPAEAAMAAFSCERLWEAKSAKRDTSAAWRVCS